ncbi:hypothetical protein AB4Z17_33480, partial [Paenibacillus sp. TAF43_2]|uniref:hypothetical protein n=1 Tax=Paenibacillus sp. TAF43_2 TaxID=3233069 RepID=UPI003F9740E6
STLHNSGSLSISFRSTLQYFFVYYSTCKHVLTMIDFIIYISILKCDKKAIIEVRAFAAKILHTNGGYFAFIIKRI